MDIRIIGTDEEKEKVIRFLQNQKIVYNQIVNIPKNISEENILLWSKQGKGKSKIEEFLKENNSPGEDSNKGIKKQKSKNLSVFRIIKLIVLIAATLSFLGTFYFILKFMFAEDLDPSLDYLNNAGILFVCMVMFSLITNFLSNIEEFKD